MADIAKTEIDGEPEVFEEPDVCEGPFTLCGYTFGEHAASGIPVHYLSVLLKYFLPYDYIYDQSLKQTIESQFAENLLDLRFGVNPETASVHVTGSKAEGLAIPEYTLRKSNAVNTAEDRMDIISYGNEFICEQTIEESLESDPTEEQTTKGSSSQRGSILESVPSPGLPKNCTRMQLTTNVINSLKLHNTHELESNLHKTFLSFGEKHLRSAKSLQRLLVNLRPEMLDCDYSDEPQGVCEYGEMYAIALANWPEIAAKWATRSRTSGWPQEAYIKEITDKGVHIMPISDTPDFKYTWIYSFFLAETTLAQLLTKDQRKCFIILKLLFERYFNDPATFSHFHLKAFFLWICEFIPAVDFRDTHLGCTLLTVLETLCDVLRKRELDHYFIDGINLLADISPEQSHSLMQRVRWVMENVLECILKIDGEISFSNILSKREKLSVVFGSTMQALEESAIDEDGFISNVSEGLIELLRSYMDICRHIPSIESDLEQNLAWNVMTDLFREILVDLRDFQDVPDSMLNMDYMLSYLVSANKNPETLAQLYMYLCLRANLKDKDKIISVLQGVLTRSGRIPLLRGKQFILKSMVGILEQMEVPEETSTSNKALYMRHYKDALLDEMLGKMSLT